MTRPADCQVCGAPMLLQTETTPVATATRAVCSKWAVHPRFLFGQSEPAAGAPAAGVPR